MHHPLRCWFLAFVVCGTAAVAAPGPAPDVFIPSFSDPAEPVDVPALEPGRTIRFVTSDDYPPFNFSLPDGTLTGFNVDLARGLCDILKIACTIQVRPWSGLQTSVAANEADAAIASLAITPEARRVVAFTRPYYRTPARFVGRADSAGAATTPDSLAGKRIGVRAGTAQEAYLRTFFPKAIAAPFPTSEASRLALKVGGVEALFDDGVGSAVWLNSEAAGACCAFRGGPFTESRYFGQGAGIAVRKGDASLRRALDAALVRFSASGRFGDLYLKYFPVGFY